MAEFFVRRPIVAIVISILTVLVGVVSIVQLPIAQFPDIAPPAIQLATTYVGADALTVEQSVATPIEQQMNGVDDSIYIYSVNTNDGNMTLYVNFEVGTDPNIDQVLSQMRFTQAESQLPEDVRNFGVTIKKSTTSPLALFSLYSPNGTYDAEFLANYAYINIYDPMGRVNGIGQVSVFGAGQYAMRLWVRPDVLAQRGITVPEIVAAIREQNTVNPAGQIGGEPVPPGQEFTYTVRAQGRLVERGGVRRHRRARDARRLGDPRARRRARRARRADLQPDAAASTASRPRSSPSTRRRARTRSTRRTRRAR